MEQEEPGQVALEQDLLRTAQAEIWWPWVGKVGMAPEQGLRGDLLSNPASDRSQESNPVLDLGDWLPQSRSVQ